MVKQKDNSVSIMIHCRRLLITMSKKRKNSNVIKRPVMCVTNHAVPTVMPGWHFLDEDLLVCLSP